MTIAEHEKAYKFVFTKATPPALTIETTTGYAKTVNWAGTVSSAIATNNSSFAALSVQQQISPSSV
jgi:hypothetical protein